MTQITRTEAGTELLLSAEPDRLERAICPKARDSAPQTGHTHRFPLMMKMAASLAFFGMADPAVFATTTAGGLGEVAKHREEPGSCDERYLRNVAGESGRR